MADPQTNPDPSAAASMASTQSTFSDPAAGLVITDELKAKHPQLIDLIIHSESMNDEERQYWVNILPIMTPDQVKNLNDILTNERTQLAAIDKKYEKEISQVGQEEYLKQVDQERKVRMQERSSAEQQAKATEETTAEDLLKQIDTV